MSNEEETIWLVFNGEIYNFQELRKQRLKEEYRFRSETDSEIIIHLLDINLSDICKTPLMSTICNLDQ